ncbi:hypothetical protein [Fibrobacter sp.]|uniref:hypothetical protein n=1 Tax=Fibrobacter sp. TaxID=35828 RepID=UPI00388EC8EB
MSSKKMNIRKSLAFATVSTSLAMVACDFSADTTVKASDEPSTPGQVSEQPEGTFLQVKTLEDLPNCTASREGKTAYVNLSNAFYVCSSERWVKGNVVSGDPGEIPPEPIESSSSADTIIIVPESSSSGFVPPPPYYDCFQTWYGNEGVYRIKTGLDVGTETSGYWYTFGDDADGGMSTIIWPVPPGNEYSDDAMDPIIDYCGGLCGEYFLDKGSMYYDPFVGVGFNLGGYEDGSMVVPVDASRMGGIRVTYTSDAAITLEMGLGDDMDQKLGYDLPAVTLPKATSATTKEFPWSSFKRAGWGNGKTTGEEASKILAALKFKIQAKTGARGKFNIMAVGALDGTCSTYVPPTPKSSSSFVWPIQSSSSYIPYYGGFETWYGNEGVYKIETGLDAGGDISGYWYEFNDAVDGGESKIIWPVPKGNEYSDEAMDPIIDYCGGVCGTYQLEQGKMDYNPFVGIAFDIAGPADYWDGPAVAADASAMGGLCIAYTSDFAASLELGLSDEKEAEVGYDIPFASLPKATSVVVKDIPWSSFKQAGWGAGKITGEEAAAMLKSVRFKIQGKDGMTGSFNVMSVGALGGGCSAERYFTVIPTVDVVKLNEKKIDR